MVSACLTDKTEKTLIAISLMRGYWKESYRYANKEVSKNKILLVPISTMFIKDFIYIAHTTVRLNL